MKDYSKQIAAIYSRFDHTPALQQFICRGYSVERKKPYYGGFFNKYTFALKTGQEISFNHRDINPGGELISSIIRTMHVFDYLSDFCSGKIEVKHLENFDLEDNFSTELSIPECIDYHFWFHPNGKGDSLENIRFRKRIEGNALLNALVNDPQTEPLKNSMLKMNSSGKMAMMLNDLRSECFFCFSLKPFKSKKQIKDFIGLLKVLSQLYMDDGGYRYWEGHYRVRLGAGKAKFAERPVIAKTPGHAYHPVDTDLVPGDVVSHSKFGEGKVKEIIKAKGYIIVDFKSVGKKTLAIYLANLKKVENDAA